ncbi:MAG: ParA family protein [Lautropia sp.]
MKILVVGNQKGGVGKTTLAIHLAGYAAAKGQRVLAVDIDEGDLLEGLGPDAEIAEDTLVASGLFGSTAPSGRPLVVGDRLDLIPADVGLLDVDDMELDVVLNLRKWLRAMPDSYDLCVIDTPPNLQRRMIGALVAADALVSPMALDAFSLARIPKLNRTLENVRREFNPELRMLGFLPNRINSKARTEVQALRELLETADDLIINTPVVERSAVRAAASAGVTVWQHSRSGNARAARDELEAACAAILARLNEM